MVKGVATGFAAGVFIANLYLAPSDAAVVQEFRPRGPRFFGRYIDDAFIIAPVQVLAAIKEKLNEFHPDICWSEVASGRSAIPYLDLEFSIDGDELHWELHQKPLNQHLYVPAASRHHPATQRAMIRGEALRVLRRCKNPQAAEHHLRLFSQRLYSRGYDAATVLSQFRAARLKHSGILTHGGPRAEVCL